MTRRRAARFLIFLPLLLSGQVAYALGIDCSQALSFGAIVACTGQDGTMTISPSGAISPSPCLGTLGGGTAGRCIVTDDEYDNGFTLSIAATASLSAGVHSLQLDDLLLQTADAGPAFALTVYPASPFAVDIGGTLHIPAHSAGGDYEGTIIVTVDYE